jgi:L-lactate utilization protein LutB
MDMKPRSVGVWEDFLGEAIIALLAGRRPNEHVQPPIHPSDCRGCQ